MSTKGTHSPVANFFFGPVSVKISVDFEAKFRLVTHRCFRSIATYAFPLLYDLPALILIEKGQNTSFRGINKNASYLPLIFIPIIFKKSTQANVFFGFFLFPSIFQKPF